MSTTTDSPPDTTGSNSVVDYPAIDLYNLLDAASRRAVLTALCWRALERWESRLALEGRGDEAFNAQSVTVAREALVLLGSADPATRASATGYRPALAAGAAAAEPAPAAAVLDAIGALATVPGDQASERAVLDRALPALGTDAGDALAAAVAQQKAAREDTPRVRRWSRSAWWRCTCWHFSWCWRSPPPKRGPKGAGLRSQSSSPSQS